VSATRIKTQDIQDLNVTTGKVADHAIVGAKLGVQTTKGDVLVHDGTVALRLAVGTDNQALVADSAAAAGVSYKTVLMNANIIESETPSGSVDGANASFNLANTPVAGSLKLYKNGVRQQVGGANDYTLATATITFVAGNIPQTGDVLLADYRK
jgi:hypothetical protein